MLGLTLLPEKLAVCRLERAATLPAWATQSSFFSITCTTDELSIVCPQAVVPDGVVCEREWSALKVAGPLDFALVGILASLAQPLAAAGISIFAISTYDTDYLLVKADKLTQAVAVLRAEGHLIEMDMSHD